MQQLCTIADVVAASDADPQCMWVAQGMHAGGQAWEHAGAVAVGCRALCGRDRIVVRGPAGAASRLVREAVDALGPSFMLIGDPPVMASLLAQVWWLEPLSFFAWMDGIKQTGHRRVHSVRWLARREWQAADEVLSAASPSAYVRPWVPGVRRWAGISDPGGRLTCTLADAWSTPSVGFMTGLAVLPQARRAGQGRDVCGFVLDALLASHGRAALMEWDWNVAAVRLYMQLGMSYRRQQMLRVKPAGMR
jgi:ribosomal protein S18 acetylase RimI-like enzyme